MKVFISWAHQGEGWAAERAQKWKNTVKGLADLLVEAQVGEVVIDLWHENDPDLNWDHWCLRQVKEADFILIAMNDVWRQCWEGINGSTVNDGAVSEANAIHGLFHRDQMLFQRKVRVVLLPGTSEDDVPLDMTALKRLSVQVVTQNGINSIIRELSNRPVYPDPQILPNSTLEVSAAPSSSSLVHMEGDMLLLRFRDLLPSVKTIRDHRKMIDKPQGYVWWGWWKSPPESPQLAVWDAFEHYLRQRPGLVGLFDSGSLAGVVYRAHASAVLPPRTNEYGDTPPFAPDTPEWPFVPKYYRPKTVSDSRSCAWVKLTSIDSQPCDFYGHYQFVADDIEHHDIIIRNKDQLITAPHQTLWHVRRVQP